MSAGTPSLVARVTRQKSAQSDRFQCSDVYELWESGEVTIDHYIEDEEWGGVDETREVAVGKELPQDFFKAGVNRLINQAGRVREEPL